MLTTSVVTTVGDPATWVADDGRNLLGMSRTTWSIVRRACAMTRLSDFNSICDRISKKPTTRKLATTYTSVVRPTTTSCRRHLGEMTSSFFRFHSLLPVHWLWNDENITETRNEDLGNLFPVYDGVGAMRRTRPWLHRSHGASPLCLARLCLLTSSCSSDERPEDVTR